MSRFIRRLTTAVTQETYLVKITFTKLHLPVASYTRGVYIKCRRGKMRA